MAWRCGRATSRCRGLKFLYPRKIACAVWLCLSLVFPSAVEAGLYSTSDQVILLTSQNVEALLLNSTAAIIAEFYASWCGHCINFSPIYRSLARDIKEWKPAVDLAAIDCGTQENWKACTGYGITGYPMIKFFHAYSEAGSKGKTLPAIPHNVRGLRHRIIDVLEAHEEHWPPACPPLEPASQAEIDSFFETTNVQHLALIFEVAESYIGREVTLDLLQFDNITVRRVLSTEESLVTKLGVTDFPSCYLYYPGGNFTRLIVKSEARTFYSYAIKGLSGVVRSGKPPPVIVDVLNKTSEEPWRPFSRSRVYMADLESTLHYSLRVEVAAHNVIRGEALVALKKYVAVMTKYFPGRTIVMNVLKSLNSWLQNQTGDEISYDAFKEILDNSAQSPDTVLPEGLTWVGCQGSQPHLRRYPCGVWTLFHVLTVQAKAKNVEGAKPVEVLSAMRSYVHSFFGCRPCAEHFENMAMDSLEVETLSSAVLWLWSRHNQVNNRLAGDLSEDPNFPKILWPSPEMCPTCHTVKENGEHRWNNVQVHAFLLSYFSSDRILTDYLQEESQVLVIQKKKHESQKQAMEAQKVVERKTREALDSVIHTPSSQPNVKEGEEEEEVEGPQDEAFSYEEEEGGEGAAAVDEMRAKTSQPTPWDKPEMKVGRGRRQVHRKPSIVGMRTRELNEDILDLDSFVNQHYKAKAMELAASSWVKQRTLQRKEEPDPGPVFGLGMELDTGLGMVGLQPIEADFELDVGQKRKHLQKRDLTGRYFDNEAGLSQKGRWISLLSIGFSQVDISLCVILYFLSSMCLLTMYLFFKTRLRVRRAKVALL